MSKKDGPYQPILTIFKFSKVLGFTLHDFQYFDNPNLTKLKLKFVHIVGALLGCVLMSTPYILSLNEFQTLSTSRKLLSLICGLRVLGCCGILVSNLHNQRYLISATRHLDIVDKEISKMGTIISYGIHSKLLFVACSLLFIGTVSIRIVDIASGDAYRYVLINFWIQGFEFLLLSTNTLYLMFFLFAIRKRFISLMALINQNRKNLRNGGGDQNQLKIFLNITQMYNDLCSCAAEINKFTSWPSFISVMCNLLEGMIVANMIHKNESTFRDVLVVVSYLAVTLSTLLLPMFVEEMPEKIAIMLAGIELPESHHEMKKAKHIFLYQALHKKVEFSICGLFQMSMSSLPEQFSFCISLVLFMYQIAG